MAGLNKSYEEKEVIRAKTKQIKDMEREMKEEKKRKKEQEKERREAQEKRRLENQYKSTAYQEVHCVHFHAFKVCVLTFCCVFFSLLHIVATG